MKNQIIVTTTNNIEGWKVEEYLDIISASVVIGTGYLSEGFAEISTFWGAKSSSYQKKINSINEEVIKVLKSKANEIGANAIIGLQIDVDEISSKNKSMIMTTARGTAVRTKLLDTEKKADNGSIGQINADQLDVLLQKRYIIFNAKNNNLKLNEDTWAFITNHAVVEVGDYLIKDFSNYVVNIDKSNVNWNDEIDKRYQYLKDYFSALEYIDAVKIIYNHIELDYDESVLNKIFEIIEECNLLDFNEALRLLESNDFEKQKISVQILELDKPFYQIEDLVVIEKIIKKTETAFNPKWIKGSKKKLLSSEEKEIWNCECGKQLDITEKYCSKCKTDIWGFTADECDLEEVKETLKNKYLIIKDYLKQ